VGAGVPIDAFGIGTQMGVSADAPYVDTVYKLVEFGSRPVMKLSTGKASAPGRKQVWRGPLGDTIALRDEPGPGAAEPLLRLAMRDGRRVGPDPTIGEMRERFRIDLEAVPEGAKRLRKPEQVEVARSERLLELIERTREQALRRS